MQVESYITEQGDMESWGGGKINEDEIKNVKEYIKKLREQEL
jgi:mono/diheme cytochrome c family protein